MQHFTAVKADKREAFHESKAKILSKENKLNRKTGSDIVAPFSLVKNSLAHFRVSYKRKPSVLSSHVQAFARRLDWVVLPTGPGTQGPQRHSHEGPHWLGRQRTAGRWRVDGRAAQSRLDGRGPNWAQKWLHFNSGGSH